MVLFPLNLVLQRLWRMKQIIGRKDVVDFPSLGLFGIHVKIDTGAYTSSIHCHNIKVYKRWGRWFLRFNLLDPDHPRYDEKEIVVTEFDKKIVKNSFGESEERFIIESDILLFQELYSIELTLTDRGNMKYPVLLGRKLLGENFLVDVNQINLSRNFVLATVK